MRPNLYLKIVYRETLRDLTSKATAEMKIPNTGYTQKNGAVSKVNKKCISHITRAQVHCQQRQLSKFLMR